MARELLTQTKIRDFKACRRLYFHRHEQHLELRGSRPGRRRGHAFGVAIWAALESLDETEGVKRGEPGLQPEHANPALSVSSSDPLDAAQLAIEQAYADLSPSSQDEADEMEFEQHALSCLVPAYLQRYPARQRRELEYRLPLYRPTDMHVHGAHTLATKDNLHARSRTFDRAGKLDGLEIVSEGKCRLIEDKLVSQIDKLAIDRITLDMQTCEYVDALLARGWQTEVLYRHTRWPSIRRKKDETNEQFMGRFAEDLLTREDWYFNETRVVFPTDRLAEHRRMRWQVSKEILEARRGGIWYQTEQRCHEYGGCDFLPICTGREGAMDLYVTREDNPELEGKDA